MHTSSYGSQITGKRWSIGTGGSLFSDKARYTVCVHIKICLVVWNIFFPYIFQRGWSTTNQINMSGVFWTDWLRWWYSNRSDAGVFSSIEFLHIFASEFFWLRRGLVDEPKSQQKPTKSQRVEESVEYNMSRWCFWCFLMFCFFFVPRFVDLRARRDHSSMGFEFVNLSWFPSDTTCHLAPGLSNLVSS